MKTLKAIKAWAFFVSVQLIIRECMIVGWVLLAPLAFFRCWTPKANAHFPGRVVNAWRWNWINHVWGNDEDGVTGPDFYVAQVPNERWRAYLWSAWRNSANNLRFVFRWYPEEGAPFFKWVSKSGKWYAQAGWYPNGFPVLSAGRV